jgi:hypothetical protein
MSSFQKNAEKIIDILNELSNEQLQILFGDAKDFESWFKKQGINDKVSI